MPGDPHADKTAVHRPHGGDDTARGDVEVHERPHELPPGLFQLRDAVEGGIDASQFPFLQRGTLRLVG